MSSSHQNPNYSQAAPTSTTDNIFSKTDQDPCGADSQAKANAGEYSGRPFNYILDTSRKYFGESQAQRTIRLRHEYEMAKNKNLALQRLRCERDAASASFPNASGSAAGPASVKGRCLDLRPKLLRRQLQQVNDNKSQAFSPAARADRFAEFQKNLRLCHSKCSTPKQPRSRSCPSPSPAQAAPHLSADHLPKLSSRLIQSTCCSPTRPICPSEARRLALAAPIAAKKVQGQVGKIRADTPRTRATKAVEDATATRGISGPGAPQKASVGSHGKQRQRQNMANRSESSSQMNPASGSHPVKRWPQEALKNPEAPRNITQSLVTTTATGDRTPAQGLIGLGEPILSQTLIVSSPTLEPNSERHQISTRKVKYRSSPTSSPIENPRMPADSRDEALHTPYHSLVFDEAALHSGQAQAQAEDTQYDHEDMDISDHKSVSPAAYSSKVHDGSWRIPLEDFTCYERTLPLGCTNSQANNETLGAELDPTEYYELPLSLGVQHFCPPCEQPKASLFRCLAKKLGSTYQFISGLMEPQHTEETLADSWSQLEAQIVDSTEDCANANARTGCHYVQFGDKDNDEAEDALGNSIIEGLIKNEYLLDYPRDFSAFEAGLADDPMTLLEAFSMLIDQERGELKGVISEKSTEKPIEDCIDQYFAKKDPTDLNRSIKGLLTSEYLNDQERNERPKDTSWQVEAEVEKLAINFPNNNGKLMAFIGHTKPSHGESV